MSRTFPWSVRDRHDLAHIPARPSPFHQPCAAVRIFGLATAPFSDLSGSPGDGTLPWFQKEVKFQSGNRSALNAGQACASGMYRAVLFANENKSASGETKIMTDPRKRR
jgi:hypothetical protein